MKDIIIEALKWSWHHYPELTCCLILGIIIFYAGFKAKGLYSRFHKIESMLPTLEKVAKQLDRLITILITKQLVESDLLQDNSPLQLTVGGNLLLNRSGGKSFVDSNISNLLFDIEVKRFKTALDVENYASEVIANQTETDSFIPIKKFIYNNPRIIDDHNHKPIQVNLEKVIQLMGIYLRDKYLEAHPELNR